MCDINNSQKVSLNKQRKNTKLSSQQRIVKTLLKRKITSKQGCRLFRIQDFRRQVSTLRKKGLAVRTEPIYEVNKEGKRIRRNLYWIERANK